MTVREELEKITSITSPLSHETKTDYIIRLIYTLDTLIGEWVRKKVLTEKEALQLGISNEVMTKEMAELILCSPNAGIQELIKALEKKQWEMLSRTTQRFVNDVVKKINNNKYNFDFKLFEGEINEKTSGN